MHSHRLVSPLAAAASVAPWVIATIVFGQDAAKPTDQPAAEPPPDPAASATASPAPAAPAPAEPAPAEPTPSPLSLQLNLDFTNIYFYHGILQQDHIGERRHRAIRSGRKRIQAINHPLCRDLRKTWHRQPRLSHQQEEIFLAVDAQGLADRLIINATK